LARQEEEGEEEKEQELAEKARFTTLTNLHKSTQNFDKILENCLIIPFSTGIIPLSDNDWPDTFRIKWTLLEKIYQKNNWQDTFAHPPTPNASSISGAKPFGTINQIQKCFSSSVQQQQKVPLFSLAL